MGTQVLVPQVSKAETEKFSKQWTYNGIVVTLDDTTLTFATDWANLLIRQLAIASAQQAQAGKNQTQPPAPLITE